MSYFDFTEMPVWQDADKVVKEVYLLCRKFPKSEDYALSTQMKRASVSIAANIAEAFGRNGAKDKINFYIYARGSAFELRSHLINAVSIGFLINADKEATDQSCRNIILSLNKIIKGLGSSQP